LPRAEPVNSIRCLIKTLKDIVEGSISVAGSAGTGVGIANGDSHVPPFWHSHIQNSNSCFVISIFFALNVFDVLFACI
jgi:hypothetical protein